MAKRKRKLPRSFEDLVPAEYNPREISERAASGLKRSIEKFGDLSGLVFNARSGRVIAGHQRLDQLRALGATVELKSGQPRVAVGDHVFPIRVVDLSPTDEKAANLAANNPAIAGTFTDEVDAIARELQAQIGEDFEALNLDDLIKDREPWDKTADLVEWDASEIEMRALFVFQAPIELQAKIRAMLEHEFPGVSFDEETIHT